MPFSEIVTNKLDLYNPLIINTYLIHIAIASNFSAKYKLFRVY